MDAEARLEGLGAALRPGLHEVGAFRVIWEGDGPGSARLRIVHAELPGRTLFASRPGRAFVGAARGEARVLASRAHFRIRDRIRERCGDQRVASLAREGDAVVLRGSLHCPSGPLPWSLRLAPAPESTSQLRFELRLGREGFDRVALALAADPAERFFGFGQQFTHLDLSGRRVPIWLQEQGIGRGRQPLTLLANLLAHAGGDWSTSYAPVPHTLTSHGRSLFLENAEFSRFDLRAPGRVVVEVFADRLAGRLAGGEDPAERVEAYTAWAGRMRPLPAWLEGGVVVGVQGGTERVRAVRRTLEAAGVPVAAFWIQDWVGPRVTSFGRQLWWNWELDRSHYPGWEALVRELRAAGIRVLLYANPFLVDAREKPGVRDNLFVQARDRGLLVRAPDGSPAMTTITDFDAALLDLTDPAARAWIRDVLVRRLLGAGASGWMADFGEALPWDAVLANGERGAQWHNRYPELWAEVNREAIDAAGLGDEAVFFTRSGFTHSPRFSTLFWLGDQLVTWDRHDGMASQLTGLLSGGLSGFTLNHGDVGGYTSIQAPVVGVRRSRELFQRWAELAAFQVVFRTHEGVLPEANHQFDSDAETLGHFARMAKLHAALGFLRRELVREAATRGLPPVRPLFLHHAGDPEAWRLPPTQFLLGAELLVAPVLAPGRGTVRAWLPAGRWVHLWTGCPHRADGGTWVEVPAPLGEPAVFWPEGSPVGPRLRLELAARGIGTPAACAAR